MLIFPSVWSSLARGGVCRHRLQFIPLNALLCSGREYSFIWVLITLNDLSWFLWEILGIQRDGFQLNIYFTCIWGVDLVWGEFILLYDPPCFCFVGELVCGAFFKSIGCLLFIGRLSLRRVFLPIGWLVLGEREGVKSKSVKRLFH